MNEDLFIGLMSGTSLDGIDAALVSFGGKSPTLLKTCYTEFPSDLKKRLQSSCCSQFISIQEYGTLDARLGILFAESVNKLLESAEIQQSQIRAIGCHGQTFFHEPNGPEPFSLQIGDPNRLAQLTGITTVADFRRRDIAAGGQGAPLVPAFHRQLFQSPEENRAIINLGGIANVTFLPCLGSEQAILGFDTGPANGLLDYWIDSQLKRPFDEDGGWARTGIPNPALLEQMRQDPFFSLPPPKSTGKEYFSPTWLHRQIEPLRKELSAADIQSTLTLLTATSIADAVVRYCDYPLDTALVCGGGVHNSYLMDALEQRLACPVRSTDSEGIDPDWVEAMAFAWLAKRTLEHKPGNLPEATGARSEVILGGIYPGKG